MPLLIDGHNLIPKIPGFSLSDPDDEMQLVSLLQEYCRLCRQQAECFFDKAPLGQPRGRKHGMIQVKFAPPGQTADDEIKRRLAGLGKGVRNYTVVSSDQSIRTAARAAGAEVKSSEAFSQEIITSLRQADSPGQAGKDGFEDIPPDQDEINMWLKVFKAGKRD